MPGPPPDLVASLPEHARAAFAAAWPETPGEVEALRSRVSSHAVETHSAASRNDTVDLSLSLRIAARLRQALEGWDKLGLMQRAAVEAAIAYYALNADADDDLDTIKGFEDDAAVVNAVLAFAGRNDLTIRFAKD